MRIIWIGWALLLALMGSGAMAQTSAADPSGDWRGTIVAGEIKLRVALHLGKAASTFDSLDQGVNGLPAQMTVNGTSITVTIQAVGVFEGALSADGKELNGVLKQGPAAMPIRFERGSFSAARRPQTPAGPFPYRSEEVSYGNPRQPDVRLAGTLTLPSGNGSFPAVILITGSGAQDRDGSIMEHKPFLILADALTRRGIAVLRVDDRGVGGSSAGPPTATTVDFATDVEAGLDWLRTRTDIDPKRIGLLGHSEGALIASTVASRDPAVAFIVLMGGQGLSGKEVVVAQAQAVALANGASTEAGQKVAEIQRAILDAVIAHTDESALRTSLDAVTTRHGAPLIQPAVVSQLSSPWYRTFLSTDPTSNLRQVNAPVLALLGGKDVQVTPDQNATALRAALNRNAAARVEVLPGLNHLFQTAQTGAPSEYGTIEQTIAPVALARMVDWITEQASKKDR